MMDRLIREIMAIFGQFNGLMQANTSQIMLKEHLNNLGDPALLRNSSLSLPLHNIQSQ